MESSNSITLEDAKFYHLNWISHLEALTKGHKINSESTHVIKTDTKFGVWLYKDAQYLREIPKFKEVEFYHAKMHDAAIQLIVLLNKKTTPGFFNKSKIRKHKELVNQYFEQVTNASFHMIKALNQSEKELLKIKKTTNDSQFLKIVSDDFKMASGSTLETFENNQTSSNTISSNQDSTKNIEETENIEIESQNTPPITNVVMKTEKEVKKEMNTEERDKLDDEISRILSGK